MAKTFNEIDSKIINLIAKETKIIGDIISDGDIRIDGELKGNIKSKGRVVVGDTGRICGEINCKTSEVSGEVEGNLTISGQLSLKASSKISGDIITGKLLIEPGALFSGSCKMSDGKTKKTEK